MFKDLIDNNENWDKFFRVEDVESSMIKTIGVSGTDLFVRFRTTGGWYAVEGGAIEFDSIVYADSAGAYYNSNIKNEYVIYEIMNDGNKRLV